MTPEQRNLILKAADMYGCAETSWRRQSNSDDLIAYVDSLLAQARAGEREACAIAAENRYMDTCIQGNYSPAVWQKWNAAPAIRARKDSTT